MVPGTEHVDSLDARIDALLTHVEPAYHRFCAGFLRGEGVTLAQAWQDWHLWHNLFAHHEHLWRWGEGTYVEVGVWNPLKLSNTLFFDKCLGWRGLCHEPNPIWHDLIRKNRSCELVPHCVLDRAQPVVLSVNRRSEGHQAMAHVQAATMADAQRGLQMQCVSLNESLRTHGISQNSFELLSIDIEGSEPAALRCFPFEELGPRAILMETANAGEDLRPLDRFFHRHNYANRETFAVGQGKRATIIDHLFVRNSHRRRHPPVLLNRSAAEPALPQSLDRLPGEAGVAVASWTAWEPTSREWGECVEPDAPNE